MSKINKFIMVVLCLIVLSSCSTTSVKNSWKNPNLTKSSFKNVLVIGVHKDVGIRTEYEVKLSSKLKKAGVNAIAASEIKDLRGNRSKEQVIEIVKKEGYESVLVTKYQALKQEEIYRQGYTEYQLIGYRGFFDPFYSNGMIEIHHPGYTIDRETLYLEVSLFETNEGQIAWRGLTASLNPAANNVIDDVTSAITQKVTAAGLFN